MRLGEGGATAVPRKLAPYGAVVLALVLRLNGLTAQGFWRDEVDAMRFACDGAVSSLRQAGWNGPLYTLALKPWIEATGTSELTLRFSSVIPGVALVALLFWLGRRMIGARGALSAALAAAVSPYLVWYGQELKMYALLATLAAASYAALVAALDRGGWRRWALYAALTGVIPYVHILGVLLLPAQSLALLLSWRAQPRRRAWLTTTAVMYLPYVPLAIWQAPYLASGIETGHPYYPLPRMLAILSRAWTLGIVGLPGWWPMLPCALALLAAAGARVPRRRSPTVTANGLTTPTREAHVHGVGPLLWTWFLVPILLDWLISLRSPVFTDRYLIASLPAALLLVALGVEAVAGWWRPVGAMLLSAVLVVSLMGVWQQWRHPAKADIRGAAAVIGEQWRDGDVILVQIPYLRHSLDYYLGDGYPIVEGPFTNYGMTEEGFTAEVGPKVAGYGRLWLLLSEADMWDSRGLTLPWCQDHGTQAGEWHFVRADLYVFALSTE